MKTVTVKSIFGTILQSVADHKSSMTSNTGIKMERVPKGTKLEFVRDHSVDREGKIIVVKFNNEEWFMPL